MNLRAILVLIATIIWFLLGGLTNWVCRECSDQAAVASNKQQGLLPGGISADTEMDHGPLVFQWSDEEPIIHSSKFESYKDSLLQGYQAGDSLLITGYYFEEEVHDTDFDNLGLARATQVKGLFSQYVNPDMIVLKSERVAKREGVEDHLFESTELRIISGVPDISARTAVYFPYNSAQRIPDNEIDGYLGRLMEVLSKTDKKLTITGHTDTIGGERFNQELGMQRANSIRDILISRGIDADRISVFSKGFSDPVSTNKTEEGRKLNRRAEIVIQ